MTDDSLSWEKQTYREHVAFNAKTGEIFAIIAESMIASRWNANLRDGNKWIGEFMTEAQAKRAVYEKWCATSSPIAGDLPQDKSIDGAVKKEREACAKQCEDIYSYRGAFSAGPMCSKTLETAAKAIRARAAIAAYKEKQQ